MIISVTIRVPDTVAPLMRAMQPDATEIGPREVQQYCAGVLASAFALFGPHGRQVSREIIALNIDESVVVR